MAQLRIWDFGAPRKSKYLNDHFRAIVPVKTIYRGYRVEATPTPSLSLDINLGGSMPSVLMTEEGIRIEETESISQPVAITPDVTNDRYDWIVAAHQYTDQNNPQVYEVIEGTAGAPPLPPMTLPPHKVLLATVRVPAGATAITNDLIHGAREVHLGEPIDRYLIGPLRPTPQAVPNDTVFVKGGSYVNSRGRKSITVADSVADALQFPVVTAAGQERIDLLVLDDSGVAGRIEGIEAVAGSAVPPEYPNNKQTIAEVTVDEADFVQVTPGDIRDVRFLFSLVGAGAIAGIGDAFPAGPEDGTLFFRRDLALLHVFDALEAGGTWIPVSGGSFSGDAISTKGTPLFAFATAAEDGYVWKYIHSQLRFELRPDSTILEPVQMDFNAPGVFALALATDLLETVSRTAFAWRLPAKTLIGIYFKSLNIDTGASQPNQNLTINGVPVCTADVPASTSWVAGTIDPGAADVVPGDEFEITTDGGGTNNDAANLVIQTVWG